MWDLSHYPKQHPTASTRNSLNNVNKLGCGQLRRHFVVINQQLEISMVAIDNKQSIKAERSTYGRHYRGLTEVTWETGVN
jgi:tricorn protease-like protein